MLEPHVHSGKISNPSRAESQVNRLAAKFGLKPVEF